MAIVLRFQLCTRDIIIFIEDSHNLWGSSLYVRIYPQEYNIVKSNSLMYLVKPCQGNKMEKIKSQISNQFWQRNGRYFKFVRPGPWPTYIQAVVDNTPDVCYTSGYSRASLYEWKCSHVFGGFFFLFLGLCTLAFMKVLLE